jgi:protease-4
MFRHPLAALILLACAAAPAWAAAPTPALPYLLHGNESVAAADGALGAIFNPAALGTRYPAELLVAYSRAPGRREINDGLLALGGLGFRATRVRDVAQLYGVSLGGGGDALRVGETAQWQVSALTHTRIVDHRVGMLSRPAPWLSLGGVVDHLFQPGIDRTTLRRVYTLGLGLRPLAVPIAVAHAIGPRLTLTADCSLAEGGARGQARVRVGAEVEPIAGIALRGALEDHGGFHLGLGLRGPSTSVGMHRASEKAGAPDYVTSTVSVHAGEDRTALAARSPRRVAVIRAGGALGDEALSGFSLFGASSATPAGPIHRQLERAREDPLTGGVLLELDGLSNMAQIEELRPRIAALRAAGKPVVAYLENGGGRGDLFLASACDRVFATEEAFFVGLGLRGERRYYRGLLADWGVKIDRSSIGKYKSAYRNYSADSTPAPDREVIEHALDVSQGLFVDAVARDRRMDRARLETLLDGRAWPPGDLVMAGLIDSVGYREDALRVLGRLAGLGDKPRGVNLLRRPPARADWRVPAGIAVVYASGGIATGPSGNDLLLGPTLGAATYVRQIEGAFKRGDVKAVVLRIESPGGEALASNLMHHATLRLKRETRKPLVVSMGGVAASGGYYLALPGDRIFADRFTRTGSIGVVTIKPSFEGWYAKHGVRQDEFERGRYMRGLSENRDWDAEIQASADSAIARSYEVFLSKVTSGRSLTRDEAHAVAQGRVWMGDDARERRLVDEIGGLGQAIAEARRRARIPEGAKLEPAEFRRPRPPFVQRMLGSALAGTLERNARLTNLDAPLDWWDEAEAP